MQTWLNGVPAADHLDAMTLSGFIGLQVHGVGKREDPLEVRWRNIRIQELGAHRWRSLHHDVELPKVEGPVTAKETPAWLRLRSTETGVVSWPSVSGASPYALRIAHRDLEGDVHLRWPDGTRQVAVPRPEGDGPHVFTLLGSGARARSEPRQPVATIDPPVTSGPGGALVLRDESRITLDRIERLVPVTMGPAFGAAPDGATQLIGSEIGFDHWRRSGSSKPVGWKLEEGVATIVPERAQSRPPRATRTFGSTSSS